MDAECWKEPYNRLFSSISSASYFGWKNYALHSPSAHFWVPNHIRLIGLTDFTFPKDHELCHYDWSSWFDKRNWFEQSHVTAVWGGTPRGWPSTIIFQAPMLKTRGNLVPLLVVCWVFILLLQIGSLGRQPSGSEPCTASALHQKSPWRLGYVARYT